MPARLVIPLLLAAGLSAQAAGVGAGRTEVRMATLPGLRYEYSRFYVRPGAAVELVIENRDSMMHNLVLTRPGARMKVVMQAVELGADAAAADYVPKSADVLWSLGVIAPHATRRLRFVAPQAAGEYPYVCTYPGHGFVMFGTMVVTTDPKPPVKSELTAGHATHRHGDLDRILVRRMFMPAAGPAAIVVSQPDGRSYCWDAGACRLRYAWAGGPITKVRMGTAPALTGPVLFRGIDGFPLRFGDDPNRAPRRVRYRGYRLDGAGEPEFEYEVDGIQVRERVTVTRGKVQRTFRIAAGDRTVWFACAADAPAAAQPPARRRPGAGGALVFLRFDGGAGRAFTVFSPYQPAAGDKEGK